MKGQHFTFIVEKTHTGFSAYAEDYPVITTGSDIHELKQNMLDAINTWLESQGKKEVTDEAIHMRLDLQQFFKYYNVLNAKVLAGRIGMDNSLLSQYVSGKKTPSEKQVQRIVGGIRDLGKELMQLEVV
jgi:predicted RNase H-like HicB family nuclease